MSTPIEPIVQFANHGFMPFAGRGQELQQIQAFCVGLDDAELLRVMLVSGEAGIGKSRLFEEALPGIINGGTCIIRTKLHVDTADSLVALLADSLWRSETTRSILKKAPDASLASVLGALRRLARLRRLLVIIEDIHLITDKSVEQFASLVAALSDEPVGMLFSTRPVTLAVRGIIEPYLIETSELHGLTTEAVTAIWDEIFGDHESDSKLIEQLLQKTTGNPLALRMALRTGVRSDQAGSLLDIDQVTLRLDRPGLEHSLETSRRLLAEGMIAHLTGEEREWAARLATLGEFFSRKAAMIYLENGELAITQLQAKGILMDAYSAPRVINGGTITEIPLLFTHTLLHNHFVELNRFDINGFWRILGSEFPLYSVVPIRFIKAFVTELICTDELFFKGIEHYQSLLTLLNITDRIPIEELQSLFQGLEAVAATYSPRLQQDQILHLKVVVAHLHVALFRHNASENEERRDEYLTLLQNYLDLTHDDLPDHLLHHRIAALGWSYIHKAFIHDEIDSVLWQQIEDMVENRPELIVSRAYISFMSWILLYISSSTERHPAGTDQLHKLLDRIHKRISEVISCDNQSATLGIRSSTYGYLAFLYRNTEELNFCKRMFLQYEQVTGPIGHYHYKFNATKFLVMVGNIEILLGRTLAQVNSQKQQQIPDDSFLTLPLILTACNLSLNEISQFMRQNKEHINPQQWYYIAEALHFYGTIRGDVKWADELFFEFASVAYPLNCFDACIRYWFMQGTLNDNIDLARKLLYQHIEVNAIVNVECAPFNKGSILRLAQFIFHEAGRASETELEAALRNDLLNPLVDHNRFLDLLTLLTLLVHAQQQELSILHQRLLPELRQAITRTMNWLIETNRIIFARIFPEHFWQCFTEAEKKNWLLLIDSKLEAQRLRLRSHEDHSDRRIQLSMTGKVGYRRNSSEELQGIKGIRLKQVLGLMTLNAILARPLSRSEFFAVVADHDADDETRRNAIKVAVYQLRKLLGQQSILQGVETPYLNLDLVQIDLIEAHNAIVAAESEFNRRSLKNAGTQLYRVLHLMKGEVAFPTLYDPVFESAREDLENRLRRVILNICRGLLHEGDEENCESILRMAVRQIPGDEELDELLLHVLHVEEKRLEAVRVKSASSLG